MFCVPPDSKAVCVSQGLVFQRNTRAAMSACSLTAERLTCPMMMVGERPLAVRSLRHK